MSRIALRHRFALGSLAVLLIGFVLLVAMAALLPPGAVRSVRLDAIAAALRGSGKEPLIREIVATAPESDARWLDAPDARRRLAALLHVAVADVRLQVGAPVMIRPVAVDTTDRTVSRAAFLPLWQDNVVLPSPPVVTAPPAAAPPGPTAPTQATEGPAVQRTPPRPTRRTVLESLARPVVPKSVPTLDATPSDAAPPTLRPSPVTAITKVAPGPAIRPQRTVAPARSGGDNGIVGVTGPFRAALRIPTGGWAVVRAVDEPFPNTAQQRMLLWFLVALAVGGPMAWIAGFALMRPIRHFANAVEHAGRDPAAALPADSPPELAAITVGLGRMRARARALAADRAALAEVLRTELHAPLERLRRTADAAPRSVRDAFDDDLSDVQEAVAALDLFLHDAEQVGRFVRHDLARLVRGVAKAAAERGLMVDVDAPVPVWIDGDGDTLSQAIDMLVRHVRGGQGAGVSLRVSVDAMVGIVSAVRANVATPVFAPGLRAKAEVADTVRPAGGELAVARSIARSHRGAVRLLRTDQGVTVQMGIPLSRD